MVGVGWGGWLSLIGGFEGLYVCLHWEEMG